MHYWKLSYREYLELPAGLYGMMVQLQQEAIRESKKKR